MRAESGHSARKRILSNASAPEMEPDRKHCRLSVVLSRSPLRPIQQSRRRPKPPLVKRSSLVDGCVEVVPRSRVPAGGGARATTAAQPRQPAKICHGYETRAAVNRKRAEEAAAAAEKKSEPASEKQSDLAAEERQLPAKDAKERQLSAEERQLSADEAALADEAEPGTAQPLLPADQTKPASGVPETTKAAEDEYVEDILQELLEQEELQRLDTDFLAGQPSVTASDRAVVVDWLIMVQHYLRLTGGTLHLALALLDRVLADLSCPLDNLQLLGVACLWLAAKMEDPRLPSARQLLKLTMDGYALGSLLNMELLVVRVTDFRLLRVHPGAFVSLQLHRRRLTAGEQGERLTHTCEYLLDLAGCRLGGVHRPPSLVAVAVIHTALLLLGNAAGRHGDVTGRHGDETPPCSPDDLLYHREEDVLSISTLLLLELRDSHTSKLKGARNKFSSQSRYQGLALCEQLSPAHVQRVLLRQLGRPLLPPPQSPASRLSQEY
ncbi:G2/mitotic-specific cyclin-B1-like [Amphibalanus amphitrite]|uniref:G2/mitotic-specific cyclin-B1-like n=1 Tax=Amphibalanus amphitrite TaxID=1232801 RepID=UPI001C91DAF5|nr:G2/mitotic-specific cyclin-B1-like [Amphibalanus amphitrite]XP_043205049.1 G2/mitotic-specific cyclin-B1-like [Amphibalanus amphitrite]